MRQIVKSIALVGLALVITAILIIVTAFWQGVLTVEQVRNAVGFVSKVKPIVNHLEDPFLAQKLVTIKSFDDKSVVLIFKDGGEISKYALNEELVVLREEGNPEIKSFSVSVLREEDLGKYLRLVPIYIRPKPELPEKKVFGLYL